MATRNEWLAPVRGCYLEPEYWRVFDDVLPCFAELTADGWRTCGAVESRAELPHIIEALGLAPHIERIFNSAETGFEKPHPQAFRNVIDALGRVDALWMIGDSATADVGGANGWGFRRFWWSRDPQADFCCEGLAELRAGANCYLTLWGNL
jgi:putative hydrolase of the HAD superfamily